METSKLSKLDFRPSAAFVLLSILLGCSFVWRDRTGWNLSQGATSRHHSEIAAPLKQQIPSTICRWLGFGEYNAVSQGAVNSNLRAGGPRSRCAAKCAAPAPAGIFLLGSDPSFCFSPLVIIILCFLVYKRLSMCHLLSPRRILWIRHCVIPRGNSDA